MSPRPRTARRFAPRIETPLHACGARRRVPIRRYRFVKGENPPFHTFPRTRLATNQVRCRRLFARRRSAPGIPVGGLLREKTGPRDFETSGPGARAHRWTKFGLPGGQEMSPRPRTARRFAPRLETPLHACGARRRIPIRRYRFVKGENPPFHTFPRTRLAANEIRCHRFFRPVAFSARNAGWRPPPGANGAA